jgi:hypothetical protein
MILPRCPVACFDFFLIVCDVNDFFVGRRVLIDFSYSKFLLFYPNFLVGGRFVGVVSVSIAS